MSANSPQQNPHHHDTAPPTDGGPTAAVPPAGDATLTTTSVAHSSDRIASAADAAAAAAAAATAAQHHPYAYDAAGDAETLSYPPPDPSSQQTLLPPANFTPFFTLVEDAATAEHHHPRVHYVFSDDDPDLHTAVFIRALGDTASLHASPAATLKHPHHFLQHADDDHNNNTGRHADELLLPPPPPGVRERFVVLDLAADGHTVAGATSLSREWQVVGTAVGPAPSFAEDGADDPSGIGGALMLRVEGTEIRPSSSRAAGGGLEGAAQDEEVVAAALGEARRAADGELVGGMEELLGRFDGGVEVLRKVVGADVEVVVAAEEAEAEREDGAAV